MTDGGHLEIDQLISSINEVAQSSRAVLAGLMFVALTIVATVLATTDQSVLRNSVEIAPQLGISLPVTLIHLLAPPVFLFLHVSALLQLDVLNQRLAKPIYPTPRFVSKDLRFRPSNVLGLAISWRWNRVKNTHQQNE